MRSTASDALPWQSHVPPPDRRLNSAEPAIASDLARPAKRYRLREHEPALVSDASSPCRSSRCATALTLVHTTKTVSTTAPIEERWIPDPRRLPSVGSPGGSPSPVPARFQRARTRPSDVRFTRRALPLRASSACSTFSRNRKWPHRTDAAYRLLQPSESMGTPRERLVLAQNPLFRRILSAGIWVPSQRAARFPELTLRAPEGKTATGLQAPEPACAENRVEAHS
jgi:hypothetical protein